MVVLGRTMATDARAFENGPFILYGRDLGAPPLRERWAAMRHIDERLGGTGVPSK